MRLLKPRPVDPRVGVRDIDVLRPGANLPAITTRARRHPALGGALRARASRSATTTWPSAGGSRSWAQPYPHPFQAALAALVNLADDYADQTPADANDGSGVPQLAGEPDPLIMPPLYGRWHALTRGC